ncbi:hypothetical protein LTR15_011242 [Elasticomyces elasticus]|nr:hypothetical protein LTR15_011242 [Elasticomyces elasticus]
MAGVQPNYKLAVQEALQWLKDNGCDSCASDQPSDPRLTKRFIPKKALRNHFDYNRLTTILEALRPDYRRPQCQLIAGSIIREKYQVVFCILLRINRAQYVETFLRNDFSDSFLPVVQRPPEFPDSVSFEAFRDKQWPFCAYKLFTGMAKNIPPERIIAIESRTELAKGDGTTIYKIRVHPEYDGLLDNDAAVSDDSHTYVLKVYDGPDAQRHHDAEVEAYNKILSGGWDIESLLRYYGTYTYEGMHYVILEYADAGTLEDFLKNTPQPTQGEDIIAMWRGAFSLVEAVSRVHMQHGWHQDIDLGNILVRSKSEASPYSWSLKLADYGRSHFKDPDMASIATTDYDTFGTKTYDVQTTRLQVPQSVDIWSLGCVWSEVAVWIVKGYGGLQLYRKQRIAATDELGLHNPGFFHNGEAVLPCIREVHNGLRWFPMSDEDYLTGNVWQGLIEKMLQADGSERPASHELRKETNKRLSDAAASLPDSVRINSGADIPRVASPRVQSRAQTLPSFAESDLKAGQKRRNTSDPSILHDCSHLTQSPRHSFDRPGGSIGRLPFRNQSPALSHMQTAMEGDEDVLNDDFGEGASTSQHSPSSAKGRHEQRSLTFVGSPTTYRHTPLTGRSQGHGVIEQRRGTVPLPSYQGYTGPSREGIEDVSGNPHQETKLRQRKDSRFGSRAEADIMSPSSSESRKSVPVLEILAAFHWMSQKKGGNRHAYLPYGDRLKGLLRNRDHLFLIDDSTSMYSCLSDLCALFELLAYIVEDDDPDGIDVTCANSGDSWKGKDSSKLAKHVNNIAWNGRTNLEDRLAEILVAYEEKLRARGPQPKNPVRPLTVYILTDGIWGGGGNPEVPIMAMVQALADLGMGREQVGVQFIVFGENSAGLQHLEKIDDMQGAYTLPLDIVDTERANGNVWKMLRGAIDDVFDGGVSSNAHDGRQ